jgi:threonine/homoserine/homoserine lactone efflux protein
MEEGRAMTVILLIVIAAGVWVMAAESVVYAAVRLTRWIRESRRAVAIARRITAAQQEPEDV